MYNLIVYMSSVGILLISPGFKRESLYLPPDAMASVFVHT